MDTNNNIIIKLSPMLEGYRETAGLPTSPTDREIKLCLKLIKLENMTVGKYSIEKINGSIWDLWNVYINEINMFSMSETMDGYSIRNSYSDDRWIDDILLMT